MSQFAEDDLIDSYRECLRWRFNCRLDLFPEHIHLVGTRQGQQYDMRIPLGQIHPLSNRYLLANENYSAAWYVVALSAAAMILSQLIEPPIASLFAVAAITFTFTFLWMWRNPAKISYRYYSDQSKSRVPVFAVAKCGPQEAHFEVFLEALDQQIRIAHAVGSFRSEDPGSPE